LSEIKASHGRCVMQDASLSMDRSTMRWEQALVYAVGALLFIGAASPVFQLHGAAIVVGFILMVLSLGDGPHGIKVLYRDVKRHVVGP